MRPLPPARPARRSPIAVLAAAVAGCLVAGCGAGGAMPAGTGPSPPAAPAPPQAASPNPQRSGAPVVALSYCTPAAGASAADPCWSGGGATTMSVVASGEVCDCFAASFQAAWDQQDLYVFEAVHNPVGFDVANADAVRPWLTDAMEVYVAADNAARAALAAPDWRFVLPLGAPGSVWVAAGRSAAGVRGYVQNVALGYDVMLAIPWALLGVGPGVGQAVGLDPAIDVYGGGDAQNEVMAWGTAGTASPPPAQWGQAVLAG